MADVRRALNGASRLNAQDTKTILNVGMYLLMLDQDLAYFTDDLVCAIGERRRTFCAKHEAILLYEAAEDLPQLLGRRFREATRTAGASVSQMERLNSVSSALSAFWTTHRVFLGDIRNAVGAHREHDAQRYVERLDTISPIDVMRCAAALSGLLDELVRVLTEITVLRSGSRAILDDMRRSTSTSKAG
jgi:hypothetical protein